MVSPTAPSTPPGSVIVPAAYQDGDGQRVVRGEPAGCTDWTTYLRSGSSPGSRTGTGTVNREVAVWTYAYSASERSREMTPSSVAAGSGWSAWTTSPVCSSPRCRL